MAIWARHGQHPRRTEALGHLAASASDPQVFTWLWSLITAPFGAADWSATAQMPGEVAVPEALWAEVAAELADTPSDDAARDTAREAILARQQPTTPGALELVRAVLGAEAAVVPEVRGEAARVLGASRDREARAALLAAAQSSSTWLQRAQWLTYLRPPLDEGEVAAILAVVDESRPHLSSSVGAGVSASTPLWACVQLLVAALPTSERLTVLNQPGCTDMLVAGPVMQSLGVDGASAVGQMLERAAVGNVREPVVQAICQVPGLAESGF